jgi:hypothetical protein
VRSRAAIGIAFTRHGAPVMTAATAVGSISRYDVPVSPPRAKRDPREAELPSPGAELLMKVFFWDKEILLFPCVEKPTA